MHTSIWPECYGLIQSHMVFRLHYLVYHVGRALSGPFCYWFLPQTTMAFLAHLGEPRHVVYMPTTQALSLAGYTSVSRLFSNPILEYEHCAHAPRPIFWLTGTPFYMETALLHLMSPLWDETAVTKRGEDYGDWDILSKGTLPTFLYPLNTTLEFDPMKLNWGSFSNTSKIGPAYVFTPLWNTDKFLMEL